MYDHNRIELPGTLDFGFVWFYAHNASEIVRWGFFVKVPEDFNLVVFHKLMVVAKVQVCCRYIQHRNPFLC